MLELIPLFIGVFLAQVSPGPNLLATASAALAGGRRDGLSTAAGIATGVFVWAILFSLGIGALIAAFPDLLTAMKLVGGTYLILLGARALRTALTLRAWAAPAPRLRHRPFLTGLAVVLTNPKAAMMWVAVSMFLAGSGVSGLAVLPVGVGVALSALIVYSGYALLFSTGFATRGYARVFRPVEAAFAAVFGAIGARLALDGLRELR